MYENAILEQITNPHNNLNEDFLLPDNIFKSSNDSQFLQNNHPASY